MTARLPLTRLATSALPRRTLTTTTTSSTTSSALARLTGKNALLATPLARVHRSGSNASRLGLVGSAQAGQGKRWASAEAQSGEGQTMVSSQVLRGVSRWIAG